jgi:hypothetical protein
MGLSSLPYDLLLNVATYLDLHDIHALHLVSLLFSPSSAAERATRSGTDESLLAVVLPPLKPLIFSMLSRPANLFTTSPVLVLYTANSHMIFLVDAALCL